MTPKEKINELSDRLNKLLSQQERFNAEIRQLKTEIEQLKPKENPKVISSPPPPPPPVSQAKLPPKASFPPLPKPKGWRDYLQGDSLEAFIGGNLTNKVGIIILIIGMGWFVRYALDNGLLSPAMRVILGVVAGWALIATAWWLHEKYKTYSAVLFSGGAAVLYFSIYAANAFHSPPILTQIPAVILLVMITIMTVAVANRYNFQLIGVYGLVGAYAIPLLLGGNPGEGPVMMLYIAIINIGVWLLSQQRYWRWMIYTAFFASWLLYIAWYFSLQETSIYVNWTYAVFNFALFYSLFVLLTKRHDQRLSIINGVLIGVNALLFYVLGIGLLPDTIGLKGGFSLLNAIIHFGIGMHLYKLLSDKRSLNILVGLSIFFLTVAIALETSGLLLVLLWAVEAVALFVVARQFKVRIPELLSLGVFLLALVYFMSESNLYYFSQVFTSYSFLVNRYFLTALFLMFALWVIYYRNEETEQTLPDWSRRKQYLSFVLSGAIAGLAYISLYNEIYGFYEYRYMESLKIANDGDFNLLRFRAMSLIIYSMAFLFILGLLNEKWWKRLGVNTFLLLFSSIVVVVFFTAGLPTLNTMRSSYLLGNHLPEFDHQWTLLGIRYISYFFLALLMYIAGRMVKRVKEVKGLDTLYLLAMHAGILIILSQEWATLMLTQTELGTESLAYRVGLRVLWGAYALFLIREGFIRPSGWLRLAAMLLLAFTLIMVVTVDLAGLSTAWKTILFVILGVVLLLVSYLYQREKGDKQEE